MAQLSELEPEYHIPVSATDYQILLALAGRPLHGLGVMRQCLYESEGVISLSSGTAYPALRRLAKCRYVRRTEQIPGHGSNHLKSIYELTPTGWLILEQETARLRQATAIATTLITRRGRQAQAWSDTIATL